VQKIAKEKLCINYWFYDTSQNGKKIHMKEFVADSLAEDPSSTQTV
jgi:hypothetical protein